MNKFSSTTIIAVTMTAGLFVGDARAGHDETIEELSVSLMRQTAAAAREPALVEGHRAAFERLMTRLVPRDRRGEVPEMTAEGIAELVRSFGVDQEKTSPVRYLATLRFAFGRDGTRSFLRAAESETTALGAAYLAGIATGVWSDGPEALATTRAPTRFEPELDPGARDRVRTRWREALSRCLTSR